MKHVDIFNAFMRETVNLNQTRIDILESRVEAIKNFLIGSDYGVRIRRFSSQGSWAHKTIIKPPNSNSEFDADLIMFVDGREDWEPEDYVEELYRTFRVSTVYKDKAGRRSRCVTIDYANDFHLDVVPCIQRESFWGDTTYHVTNRNTNEEEETVSEAFTEWLDERNRTTGGNMLRKVIRLVKYQRDIKKTFSAKSILMTTLLGMQVRDFDGLQTGILYPDLPTTLKTLIGRLDGWLQDRPDMPTITNPVLPSEDFNRHWDQAKYDNFKNMICKYRGWIDSAYDETDRFESLRKWRDVLGDAFAKDEVSKTAASADTVVVEFADSTGRDLVEMVKAKLVSFTRIPFWPHARKPEWRMARTQMQVHISATVHSSENGPHIENLISGQPLPKGRHIRFTASSSGGIPDTFRVKWRVVNSGQEATKAGQMRGGFEKSQKPRIRWERTGYRGVHWVEAFVINMRTNECMGKSSRFFVVVE
ncbi:MAG: nucleotidyltransferase [Magnetococcales bacterium]|nr:nucleotidyltransferase [Magnetococcales bacterium]